LRKLGYKNPVVLDDTITREIVGKKVSDDLNCDHYEVKSASNGRSTLQLTDILEKRKI